MLKSERLDSAILEAVTGRAKGAPVATVGQTVLTRPYCIVAAGVIEGESIQLNGRPAGSLAREPPRLSPLERTSKNSVCPVGGRVGFSGHVGERLELMTGQLGILNAQRITDCSPSRIRMHGIEVLRPVQQGPRPGRPPMK